MSRTQNIACKQCKKSLWIGQAGAGSDRGYIYSGQAHTMTALGEFLWDHIDHPLVFTEDSNLDDFEEVQPVIAPFVPKAEVTPE